MELIYEKITPEVGSSFHIIGCRGCDTFFWHVHPEYELVYIDAGSSKRHIGRHVSRYHDGDLMLIGSNVPHSNLGNRDPDNEIEVVIQMSPTLIECQLASFPEFASIQQMMRRSMHGISFGSKIKNEMGPRIIELLEMKHFERFMRLLEILNELSHKTEYSLLLDSSAEIEIHSNDYQRIELVNDYVSKHYRQTIKLSDLADLTHLTESSFSRFFKNVTGKPFSNYLMEFRIHRSKVLLSTENVTISEVMHDTGFKDLAHFSRAFKKITGQTPREFRKEVRLWE